MNNVSWSNSCYSFVSSKKYTPRKVNRASGHVLGPSRNKAPCSSSVSSHNHYFNSTSLISVHFHTLLVRLCHHFFSRYSTAVPLVYCSVWQLCFRIGSVHSKRRCVAQCGKLFDSAPMTVCVWASRNSLKSRAPRCVMTCACKYTNDEPAFLPNFLSLIESGFSLPRVVILGSRRSHSCSPGFGKHLQKTSPKAKMVSHECRCLTHS